MAKRKKYRSWISKWVLCRNKEMLTHSRRLQQKQNIFIRGMRLSSEITSLLNSKNRICRLRPNLKSSNLCMRRSDQIETWSAKSCLKFKSRKRNTIKDICGLTIKFLNWKNRLIQNKPSWSSNITSTKRKTKR